MLSLRPFHNPRGFYASLILHLIFRRINYMLIIPSNSRRLAKFCVAQFNPAVTVCLFSRLLVPTVLNIFFLS